MVHQLLALPTPGVPRAVVHGEHAHQVHDCPGFWEGEVWASVNAGRWVLPGEGFQAVQNAALDCTAHGWHLLNLHQGRLLGIDALACSCAGWKAIQFEGLFCKAEAEHVLGDADAHVRPT